MTTGRGDATLRRSERAARVAARGGPLRSWRRGRLTFTTSCLVWSALALLAWLDRDTPALAIQAGFFHAIWIGLQALGAALGAAATTVATSVAAAVVYLSNALAWLTTRVAQILSNTGAMFARVWHSAQAFYTAVLRPALIWLHEFYRRARAWLERVFKPVFRFLFRVREELRRIYTRFVRPILDILEITRAGLRVLGSLGVDWARALDRVLTRIESVITENYLKLLGRLNQVIDVVDSIVTPGRLFQRVPLVRSLQRDAGYWIRVFWNRQVVGLSRDDVAARRARAYARTDPSVLGPELGKFYRRTDSELSGIIGELVPTWQEAAGQRPALRASP